LYSSVTLLIFLASFTSNGATLSSKKKLCERAITTLSRCANLGTVLVSFPASHGIGFFPVPKISFRGPTSGSQAVESRSGMKSHVLFAHEASLPKVEE
jgi:hypothetical protein